MYAVCEQPTMQVGIWWPSMPVPRTQHAVTFCYWLPPMYCPFTTAGYFEVSMKRFGAPKVFSTQYPATWVQIHCLVLPCIPSCLCHAPLRCGYATPPCSMIWLWHHLTFLAVDLRNTLNDSMESLVWLKTKLAHQNTWIKCGKSFLFRNDHYVVVQQDLMQSENGQALAFFVAAE